MHHFINQEQEHLDFHYPSLSEINREMAFHLGAANPDKQWVCTDFDVWEKNPFYSGPEQPHPECDIYPEGAEMLPPPPAEIHVPELAGDDEIPF